MIEDELDDEGDDAVFPLTSGAGHESRHPISVALADRFIDYSCRAFLGL